VERSKAVDGHAESCKFSALPAQKRSILYQKLCSALEVAAPNCSYGDYLVDEAKLEPKSVISQARICVERMNLDGQPYLEALASLPANTLRAALPQRE